MARKKRPRPILTNSKNHKLTNSPNHYITKSQHHNITTSQNKKNMKLKPIIPKREFRSQSPTINFTKIGLLSFSKSAKEHLPEIDEAKKILILQDEDNPDDFYLHLITDPDKTEDKYPNIRMNKQNRIIANYRSAYNTIIEHFKVDHKSIRLPIGGAVNVDGIRFYTLITNVLKKPG
jgi:hypothetical protein